MTNLAKLTKAQLIAKYEELRNDANQAQVEAMELSSLLDAETAAHRATDSQLRGTSTELEDLRTKYNDLAAARQGTSRQDHSAQRFEIMQKAKAQAMASGRSVKC